MNPVAIRMAVAYTAQGKPVGKRKDVAFRVVEFVPLRIPVLPENAVKEGSFKLAGEGHAEGWNDNGRRLMTLVHEPHLSGSAVPITASVLGNDAKGAFDIPLLHAFQKAFVNPWVAEKAFDPIAEDKVPRMRSITMTDRDTAIAARQRFLTDHCALRDDAILCDLVRPAFSTYLGLPGIRDSILPLRTDFFPSNAPSNDVDPERIFLSLSRSGAEPTSETSAFFGDEWAFPDFEMLVSRAAGQLFSVASSEARLFPDLALVCRIVISARRGRLDDATRSEVSHLLASLAATVADIDRSRPTSAFLQNRGRLTASFAERIDTDGRIASFAQQVIDYGYLQEHTRHPDSPPFHPEI